MSDKKNSKPENTDPQVTLDPDSDLPPDADAEERFNNFWKKNGPGIFGGIAIGAIIVTGTQAFNYFNANKEANIQEAFANAITVDEKREFIADNAEHQLAGLAALSIADTRYEADDFIQAAELYSQAKDILDGTALASRAEMGLAMSYLMSEQTQAGQTLLESIASNASIIDGIRAEAAYHLAVSHWDGGNLRGVEAALNLIDTIAGNSIWTFRASTLRSQIPELADL